MEIKQYSTIAKATDLTVKSVKPQYIVLHYTAGVSRKGTPALNVCNWWNKDSGQASADFVVDDNEIWQYNPDIEKSYCWHSGGKKYSYKGGARLYGVAKNENSIGIELCSYRSDGNSKATAEDDGWYISEETIKNGVELVKYLRQKYNIPAENVITHFDVTGKLCPRPFLTKENDTWKVLNGFLDRFKVDEPMTENPIEKVFDEYLADMKKTMEDEDFFTQFEICTYNERSNTMEQRAITNDLKKFLNFEEWTHAFISKGYGYKYITLITVNNYCYIIRRTDVTIL